MGDTMRPPGTDHNSLGKLYHQQRASLKKKILEELHDRGIKDGKIGHWLRKISDENLPQMPGNMQDVFIEHLPGSKAILKPESIVDSPIGTQLKIDLNGDHPSINRKLSKQRN